MAWTVGIVFALFIAFLVAFYLSIDRYYQREKEEQAQLDRCISAGVCIMDCAVIIRGPTTNARSFLAITKKSKPCVLVDANGKLKEVYEHEKSNKWCAPGGSSACSQDEEGNSL